MVLTVSKSGHRPEPSDVSADKTRGSPSRRVGSDAAPDRKVARIAALARVALALLVALTIVSPVDAQQRLSAYAGRPDKSTIILVVDPQANTVHFYIGNVGAVVDPTTVRPNQLVDGGVWPLKKPFSKGIKFDADNGFTHYDLDRQPDGSMRGNANGVRNGGHAWNWDLTLVPTSHSGNE